MIFAHVTADTFGALNATTCNYDTNCLQKMKRFIYFVKKTRAIYNP